jgi:hypothetical protein
VHLRSELFEIDTRFGELGSKGIFNTLDQAGVLHHRFPGVDNISHAVNSPPLLGRAKVRGDAIQRLKGHHNRFACDWSAIVDTEASVMLDLRNPWATSENWIPNPISNETRAQFFFRQSRSTEAIESIF